jgi:hypothetical protein
LSDDSILAAAALIRPFQFEMTDRDAIPLLIPSSASSSTYDRFVFVDGSEKHPLFFDADCMPEELDHVVHAADFQLLVRAVNRLRAESWELESSKLHAFTRWLRSPLQTSFSMSDSLDIEALKTGRLAIQDFLRTESEQKWFVFGFFSLPSSP